MAFMVYNNWDLKEKKREQTKKKEQARIIAVVIGKVLVTQETSKSPLKGPKGKGFCFKCRKARHLAKECIKSPPAFYWLCQNTDTDHWHWRIDCPLVCKGDWPSKTVVAQNKSLSDWGGLGLHSPPLSKNIIITGEEPQVTLDVMGKQIQFLLHTESTYFVLPTFAGKPSTWTKIVTGVEGQYKVKNFTLLLTCQFEDKIFLQKFLIIPSCLIPHLGRDIMTKLGAILQCKHRPLRLLVLQELDNVPEHVNQQLNPLASWAWKKQNC